MDLFKKSFFCLLFVLGALINPAAFADDDDDDNDDNDRDIPVMVSDYGARAYVCNVGIGSFEASGPVCTDDSGQRCDPGDCSVDEDCNCTCRNPNLRSNSLIAKFYQLGGRGGAVAQSHVVRVGDNLNEYQTLFAEDTVGKFEVSNLFFNFASTLFTARYFVDICYEGPVDSRLWVRNDGEEEGEGDNDNDEDDDDDDDEDRSRKDKSEGRYAFELSTLFKDAISLSASLASSYVDDSELEEALEVGCDLRKVGFDRNPRGLREKFKASFEEDYYYYSGERSSSAGQSSYEALINTRKKRVPRFCRFRMYFDEKAHSTLREWGQRPTGVHLDLKVKKSQH